MAFQDSVAIDSDTQTTVPTDTLKAPGSLRGVVRLQPGHDSRKVFLIILGTFTVTSPADSAGNFALPEMAEGSYSMRLLSILDDYGVLDTSLSITAGKNDTLADTISLPYSGIPIPNGLSINYDTLKQIVTLFWNKPITGRAVQGYNVYRKHPDSTSFVKIGGVVADTVYTDSGIISTAIYQYKIAAVDTQDGEGTLSGAIYLNFTSRFKLATISPTFGERQYHSSVVHNAKMWVIAGNGNNNALMNDVWSSIDGINWTLVIASASFSKRTQHSSVVFDSKIFVIGGYDGNLRNDVWYSSNGVSWTEVTANAAFSSRSGHSSVVHDGKIWVIGGSSHVGNLNDAWYSTDGNTWNQAIDSTGFSKRNGQMAVSYANKIWVIGGDDGFNNKMNDVWSTIDGIAWTQVTGSAFFPHRSGFTAVATDTMIWIIGGFVNQNGISLPSNDVWYSHDGSVWRPLLPPPEFKGRFGNTSVWFDKRIWVFGQVSYGNVSDVWYIE